MSWHLLGKLWLRLFSSAPNKNKFNPAALRSSLLRAVSRRNANATHRRMKNENL
jgi:hypothetical protein